jgi:hypothetical protein
MTKFEFLNKAVSPLSISEETLAGLAFDDTFPSYCKTVISNQIFDKLSVEEQKEFRYVMEQIYDAIQDNHQKIRLELDSISDKVADFLTYIGYVLCYRYFCGVKTVCISWEDLL